MVGELNLDNRSLRMRYLQPIQAKGGAMPRKPRSKSPTGYFHVTLRGNGGQLLFDDAEDRIAMLQILDAILPKHNIELIAWCLMGNHIHLLIDDPDDRKSDAMHAVAVSYTGRYNARTGHIGVQKDFQHIGIMFENIVGTPTHNDTRSLGSNTTNIPGAAIVSI